MAAALPLRQPPPEPKAAREQGAGLRRLLQRRPSFVLVFGGIVAAVSVVPYVLAYLWTPAGHHFAGFFFIADDATTYLAKMRQGAEGSWLWNDPYTSEPHGGVFLFGFYLLLGHLASWLHLPLIAAYHLARITGAIALVIAAERLARRLLPSESRRTALLLIILGSGLGFLAQAMGNPSILGSRIEALDLHLPELSGWYSILAIPHFVWATALIIVALLGLLDIAERARWRPMLLTSLAMIALTAIHPQMIPVLAIIWTAYRAVLFLWGERPSRPSLLAQATPFIATVPLLVYNAWILFADPTIAEWARQWRHQAPGLVSLALSLAVPLVLAVIGIGLAWRRRDRALALVAVWPPLVFVLLYLPNIANIQRRLLDALYVPIGILAAVGLQAVLAGFNPGRARRLRAVVLSACCLSSMIVLAIALRFATGAFSEAYVTNDAWQAMQWLSSHHQVGDRALSAPAAGQLLPAWSGVSVYVGHYSETLDYFQKIKDVQAVLQAKQTPMTSLALETFLAANRITLLYWGPDEVKTGFRPGLEPYLKPIFSDATVTIYRFSP